MAKTNKETRIVAGVELIFYPDSHKYKANGKWVESVTTILGLIDKSGALMTWNERLERAYLTTLIGQKLTPEIIETSITLHNVKRDEAGDDGTAIHDYIEMFANAIIHGTDTPMITPDMNENVIRGINGFLDWYNSNEVEFLEGEMIVYSPKYNYIGKPDRILKVNGIKKLADWKSGKGIYKSVELQLNAYENALFEETGEHIDDLMVLHCNKETGEFTVHEYKRSEEVLQDFINLIRIKKYK